MLSQLYCSSQVLKKIFISSLFWGTLFSSNTVLADPPYSLSGIVLDSVTEERLAGAHVFLLESTLGAITDEEGLFSLTNLQAGEYQIGVSMVGYAPYTLKVDIATESNTAFKISLSPQIYELEAVTVTAKKNRRWKKQLEHFTLQVIGDSDNARYTKIVNPEVLDFVQQHNILIAKASDPLIIENMAMGYRIHYTLVHCAIQQGRPQYKGIARFEEISPENNRQHRKWKKNRKKAYKGSFKHLLRTLASVNDVGELANEGFRLAIVPEFPKSIQSYERAIWQSEHTIQDFVERSSAEHENLLHVKDFLLITYSKELESDRYIRNQLSQSRDPEIQRSSIELNPENTVFHDNGFLYDAYSVVLYGYMGWERMADMLPLDYSPSDG